MYYHPRYFFYGAVLARENLVFIVVHSTAFLGTKWEVQTLAKHLWNVVWMAENVFRISWEKFANPAMKDHFQAFTTVKIISLHVASY